MSTFTASKRSEFIPNSFQTPNAYVDQYMSLLTSDEWKILSYAARRIFGFQKRRDRISVSQFSTGIRSIITGEVLDSGTGLSRPTVMKCLGELMKYRLITRIADDNGQHEGAEYELQLDSSLVDLSGLLARQSRSDRKQKSKMEKVKENITGQTSSVNDIDQRKESDRSIPLTADRSIPLTEVGQYDLPNSTGRSVNSIDTQKPVKETQLKNSGNGFNKSNNLSDLWFRVLEQYNPIYNSGVSRTSFDFLRAAEIAGIESADNKATVLIGCHSASHAESLESTFRTSLKRTFVGILNVPEIEVEFIS